jgi:hypothetical protein
MLLVRLPKSTLSDGFTTCGARIRKDDGGGHPMAEPLVKAMVFVTKHWVNTSGIAELIASAQYPLAEPRIAAIPVSELDVSNAGFVAVTFYPRMLENEKIKYVKALVPAHAVVVITEFKSRDELHALGFYKPKE